MENLLIKLKDICKSRNILFIEPESFVNSTESTKGMEMESFSYAYVSPQIFIENDFDWRNETFNQYSKRTKYWLKLIKKIFQP